MRKKKNSLDPNKRKIIIVLSIIIIIFLIIYFTVSNSNDNYGSIKKDKNNYLVYTKYEDNKNNYSVNIPYVNIKGNLNSVINDDIDKFTKDYISNGNSIITYEYDISGVVLSLIIKIIDYTNKYNPDIYFQSYNINIKKLSLYDEEELFNLFNTNYNNIDASIENQFKEYYQEIVNLKYYDSSECNYNCFLKYRGIDSYTSNISYYVSNGNLYAYKPFVYYSIFGEENYFTEDHFKFLIVNMEKE